jgi:hypothetical protein
MLLPSMSAPRGSKQLEACAVDKGTLTLCETYPLEQECEADMA